MTARPTPRRRPASRRGAAAVEFALVLPILLAIITAVMEYGWLFLQQANLSAAVRDGARVGSMTAQADGPGAAVETRVRAAMTTLSLPGTAATVTTAQSVAAPAEVLTVTVSMTYTPLIGLVPTPANLNARMSMLLEDQD
jgi:Flp pilus assembly protein TadG